MRAACEDLPDGSAGSGERAAHARGWAVHLYDAKAVESQAAGLLAGRADAVLRGPRAVLGAPWAKDHRSRSPRRVVSG
jgi:hypothetical protein